MFDSVSRFQVIITLVVIGLLLIGSATFISQPTEQVTKAPSASFTPENTSAINGSVVNRTDPTQMNYSRVNETNPQFRQETADGQTVPVLVYENLSKSKQGTIDKALAANNSSAVTTLEDFPKQFLLVNGGQVYQMQSNELSAPMFLLITVGGVLIILAVLIFFRGYNNDTIVTEGREIERATENSAWDYDLEEENNG